MGRGDRKTRKGKIAIRSYGNKRLTTAAAKVATPAKKKPLVTAPTKPAVPAKKAAAPVRKKV